MNSFIKKIKEFFKDPPRMVRVKECISRRRHQLWKEGWEKVSKPPLVNNEWLWFHTLYGYMTESKAVNWLENPNEEFELFDNSYLEEKFERKSHENIT
jgi:hypothetical protein